MHSQEIEFRRSHLLLRTQIPTTDGIHGGHGQERQGSVRDKWATKTSIYGV